MRPVTIKMYEESSDGESLCKLDSENKKFRINRPVYTQKEFDDNYGAKFPKVSLKNRVKHQWGKLSTKIHNKDTWKSCCLGWLPVYGIMRKYKWKQWILSDIIAGIIVGIMHIPQSMAYALLAELKPMYGLYVSFFPSLVYFLFGTSRHLSIGTIAIISLLTGKFLDSSKIQFPYADARNLSIPYNTSDPVLYVQKVLAERDAQRVAGFCMAVGISQFAMGLLNLGYMTRYLSDPLISGFTVGAAIHVLTSQVKSLFGLKIPKQIGVFNIPKTYYYICANLAKTNIPTLILTLICIIILYVFKEFVNPRVVKKIKIPIPMELIIVICGTVASKYIQLSPVYNVTVVGFIEAGIPAPSIPNFNHLTNFITDIIVTAIIAFSICISLAKTFAKKHNYNIDSNQELYAYGLMNIFSSFFLCYPSASSVSRSAVQESVGGQTQLTAVFSSTLLLFVLLFIGPLFQSLPNCVLSAIIVVALKSIFMQFSELKELWIFSLWDFAIWVITFLTTVILDVEYGLVIGVGVSILAVMLRTQSPNSHMLGQVLGTDIYKNIDAYDKCREIDGVKIFRYEGSLYYASSEHFKKSLYHKVKVDPAKTKLLMRKLENKIKRIDKMLEKNPILEEALREKKKTLQLNLNTAVSNPTHHIIIDCSTWGYIDYVGVKTLCQVITEYKAINVTVLLANPKTDIRDAFAKSNFYKMIDDQIIFVSVHDAVVNSLFSYKVTQM